MYIYIYTYSSVYMCIYIYIQGLSGAFLGRVCMDGDSIGLYGITPQVTRKYHLITGYMAAI